MEFDWYDVPFDMSRLTSKEIEESFEDPFSMRLLPDMVGGEARYFNLGRSVGQRSIMSIFWSDGKKYRVILAREMTPEEKTFYERKNAEML